MSTLGGLREGIATGRMIAGVLASLAELDARTR